MRIHSNLTYQDGVISVSLQAQFTGDTTDEKDRKWIAAYGDPKVNLAGEFIDPNDITFKFVTGSPVVPAGITTEMYTFKASFMPNPPTPQVGKPLPNPGPLQVITPEALRAAGIWKDGVVGRIAVAMGKLRALPEPTTQLPNPDPIV